MENLLKDKKELTTKEIMVKRVKLKDLDRVKKLGKPKLFETPEDLWSHYQDYRQWILDNPMEVEDYVGKDGRLVVKKHFEPPTWMGFEAYLFEVAKLGTATKPINLDHYRYNYNDLYPRYLGVVRAIGASMFQRKFAGASVNIYNHNIIARELGLTDKKEVKTFEKPILEQGQELPKD